MNAHNNQQVPAVPEKARIVLGVAGGIAAYKACHVVRQFKELGHDVRVVPTANATEFVGRATFEALSGHPVSTTVFDAVDEVQHVRIGQEADLLVIAPATADLLARLAMGRADDLLTATFLVATCPVVIAPAMHTEMWNNPATQANVATLRSRGVIVLEPAHGRLTGKDTGPGRLLDPEQIVDLSLAALAGVRFERDLEGLRVLISAGGTREAIDPVRYIGNHSSGRQGFALAEVAAHRGAQVTLVAGNTAHLPDPAGATMVRIRSAQELGEQMYEFAGESDVVIMAAAVADYRPENAAASKLKKHGNAEALATIHLVENADVLRSLVQGREQGELAADTTIVGFAAETGDAEHSALEFAQQKFARKGCDLLMCNEVGTDKVFGQAVNEGYILRKDAEPEAVAPASKFVVANQILDAVVRHRAAQ